MVSMRQRNLQIPRAMRTSSSGSRRAPCLIAFLSACREAAEMALSEPEVTPLARSDWVACVCRGREARSASRGIIDDMAAICLDKVGSPDPLCRQVDEMTELWLTIVAYKTPQSALSQRQDKTESGQVSMPLRSKVLRYTVPYGAADSLPIRFGSIYAQTGPS